VILLDKGQMRLYIGRSATDTEHDELLDMLEHDGLALIENITGSWWGEEKEVVEYLSGFDTESLWLRSHPNSPITAIEFRPASTSSTELEFLVGGNDWQTLVSDLSEVELDGRRIFWGENVFPAGLNNLRVTYNSGFVAGAADAPGDILFALKEFVSQSFRERVTSQPVRFNQSRGRSQSARDTLTDLVRGRVLLHGV